MSSSTSRGDPQARGDDDSPPPFPTQQLFILSLCRICEPIAFMSIFPYIYYMIQSFHITSDGRPVAVYAGMVTSAFAFAEFTSGIAWGHISDKIGRKPVLILGLAGTAISMIVFGFASSLPMALIGRALGGILNGNIGVLQTTVAEIVTVKEHQPRAYAVMPFVWCLGSILGPALGGVLAQPCENFPSLFPRGTPFDQFPFLLPNLVCAVILIFGVLIGILFLEETHGEKKYRRDIGLQTGQWLLSHLTRKSTEVLVEKASKEEAALLLRDEEPPGSRTIKGPSQASSTRSTSPSAPLAFPRSTRRDLPRSGSPGVRRLITKQVILNIVGYGIMAYHTISFDQLMPVFLSEPSTSDPFSLPFQFTGGFGFSAKRIGLLMSLQGFYAMLAQIFLFPFAVKRFGTLNTFRFVVILWPTLYFLTPYLVLLPPHLQRMGVYCLLLWKTTAHVLAYPSNAILLTNSAPSLLVLGTVNGIAASTASLSRAFGPTVTGFIHTWGLEIGCTGLAWWTSGVICVLGSVESLWMEEHRD